MSFSACSPKLSVFRSNNVYNGGTVEGLIEATRLGVDLAGPNTKVIPGHGEGFTHRDGLIEDIRDTVTGMIARGMRLAEILDAEPTAPYDERWGQEPAWTARDVGPIIYNEAGGAPPTAPSN